MNDIIAILEQVKMFLKHNEKIKGAQYLLHKIDKQLNKLTQDIETLNSSLTKQSQMSEYQAPAAQNIPSQLIDMFIIEHNFHTDSYYIIPNTLSPQKQQKKTKKIDGDRSALLNLLISKIKYHVKKLQKTQSMTELHKIISNIPECKPVLILPNYSEIDQDQIVINDKNVYSQKYFYIYEESVCVQKKQQYYSIDRYYVFSTLGLSYEGISKLMRDIRKQIFLNRIVDAQNPQNVNYQNIENSLINTLPQIHQQIIKYEKMGNMTKFPILQTSEIQIKLKINVFSAYKLCRLTILLFYAAINENKIVLLVSKQRKHILTDILLSLEISLRPMKYIFPIIYASFTKQHAQYLESPVPILIGLWGSQKKRDSLTKNYHLSQFFYSSSKIPNNNDNITSLIIDLQKKLIPDVSNFSTEDTFVLQKLNNYLHKYGRGNNTAEQLNNFIKDLIFNDETSPMKKSQWTKILYKKIKKSQIFHVYKTQ